MQKKKIEEVLNQLILRNVKEVQKFLGLANYYRQFIKDFAKLAVLLHVLVRKKEKWRWGKEQKEAFRKLKEIFTIEPVLAIPDLDKEIRVEADTSDYVTERILSTKYEDGKQRPVVFISKSLNTIEQNYEIHNKEMFVRTQARMPQNYFQSELTRRTRQSSHSFAVYYLYTFCIYPYL